MRELILDGATWNTKDDVYTSFFEVVGAPTWHGKNLDALVDSIRNGDINSIEVPYRLVIRNYSKIGPGALKMADDFVELIRDLASKGCPVEIRIDDLARSR